MPRGLELASAVVGVVVVAVVENDRIVVEGEAVDHDFEVIGVDVDLYRFEDQC